MSTDSAPTPQPPGFISRPPADLAAWVSLLDARELPVLRVSAEVIEDWRQNEDAADAHLLADLLGKDPLMTLKLLSHVARLRRGRDGTDAETLTAALVMLGITPFFRHFGPQPTVEAVLAELPAARDGFQAVLRRSHRAARFALSFAVHRMDHDAAVIHEAALLHDFAELLLWVHAPALALRLAAMQQADPQLRSAVAQQAVLNVGLPELQHALMERWRLPRLLIDVADDQRARASAQARNVMLAIRLARHTAVDWNNPALDDDVTDIASLLNLSREHTLGLLRDIDAD